MIKSLTIFLDVLFYRGGLIVYSEEIKIFQGRGSNFSRGALSYGNLYDL